MALHRARQAAAERLRRELQRPPARRVAERDFCSPCSPKPARFCRSGRTTTTPSDRIAASAISRRWPTPKPALQDRNGSGRCATLRTPRPDPLLRRANRAQINLELTHRWMKEGAQVITRSDGVSDFAADARLICSETARDCIRQALFGLKLLKGGLGEWLHALPPPLRGCGDLLFLPFILFVPRCCGLRAQADHVALFLRSRFQTLERICQN